MHGKLPPVLIIHNAPRAAASGHGIESEVGVLEEVKAVTAALDRLGASHRVAALSDLCELPPLLAATPERILFNLVESFPNRPADAAYVPAICMAFGKSCTGNTSACQSLANDKWRAKAVLREAGLPVPPGVLAPVSDGWDTGRLPPSPWIVKPLQTDASEGIDAQSVVPEDLEQLRRAVARVHANFRQPALIESFVGERELNVALYQRGREVEILPPSEVVFDDFGRDRPRIVDYAAKWLPDSFEYQHTRRVVPAPLDQALAEQLRRHALAAWSTLDCQDYARVDFRADSEGRLFILEVNPNPDIAPDTGFVGALHAAGIPFEDFVAALVENAHHRRPRPAAGSGRTAKPKTARGEANIRRMRAGDLDAVLSLVRHTGFFRDDEVEVAAEVLEQAAQEGELGHYQSFVVEDQAQPVGWICFGPIPCTLGSYDIYWIVVAPSHQRRGLGKALLEFAESQIRLKGGRMAIIETSSQPRYQSTRGFYRDAAYEIVARLRDFYAPGDDKIVCAKDLSEELSLL